MGSTDESYGANRGSPTTTCCQAVCTLLSTPRRQSARVGVNGIQLRGPQGVLPSRETRTPTELRGNRTTSQGMDDVERTTAADPQRTPDTGVNGNMSRHARSPEPIGTCLVRRVQSFSIRKTVRFDTIVRVYQPTDWSYEDYRSARVGPWMQLAVDRARFKRRIQQTDQLIGHVFDQRNRVRRRLMFQ